MKKERKNGEEERNINYYYYSESHFAFSLGGRVSNAVVLWLQACGLDSPWMACTPCVCVGLLQVRQFTPTV